MPFSQCLIFDLIRRPFAHPLFATTGAAAVRPLAAPLLAARQPALQIADLLFTMAPHGSSQLGNLCPDDAEEAKTLIPSLRMPDRNLDNGSLSELLAQIGSYRSLD